ncbi:PhoA Alkaline phosphatase [Pyrenophora tritici-repentis]|uniref:alkaline phosphatase n=3 Tax=Pyrenophora tritici-repentis TaxID=45151 RepID=A0A2W1G9F9_9PLEO|nr:alkaline phosphatase precursor [Pyrenophora tritici-repentis Pt-1C-BFP]KAF7444655.1 Alkaline phosphatase [Pyrenophora tritici-repentis]EDU50180.1 alkaline phosphatase precursor [Pyrenophora tritici-repentis Pt-1C-BFP]KAG9378901.1 Alkaline phosphatase [Pyrenophora tritici-repentis]KAI0580340.1 Alkaline phosphatase [Pyrenophora tritici-repentis]KAI0580446.1 Alkaline phosphatase [Pyrenophora tritici-repentis]
MKCTCSSIGAAALLVGSVFAQTFRRLGACESLGCLFPPSQADFLAGQYFDIRLEVHQPMNGSEFIGLPLDENFTLTVSKKGEEVQNATEFFEVEEPKLEKWNFTWYEDLFARDAKTPSFVNVAAKAYRRVALYEPGEYTATLNYNNGSKTEATWFVRPLAEERKAKNIILFIGDGMTTAMITAARLIAHKQINGKYQSLMAMDKFPILGHQMTHSIDSFITDSANSAAALNTGHKSSVNCLNVYADSSKDPFDDPKVETMAEIFHRVTGGHIGIVSTAYIADATPAALVAHTRLRSEYGAIVDTFLNGVQNYTWTNAPIDVIFGGGGENFYNSSLDGKTYQDKDYYKEFAAQDYQIVHDRIALANADPKEKTLGIFTTSNMAKWLDRNVYRDNLNQSLSPTGDKKPALDQPGLREMTLKAIDILEARSGDAGWLLMSEAASIDKMMHVLDYDRALGELLELDDTVKATIAHLNSTDSLKETLIIVTADHGHGFDVIGSVDTKYLNAQGDDRKKREAIGVYEQSGGSQYINTGNLTYTDRNFPSNWSPRYTLAEGFMANPDHRETWSVHKDGPRTPATELEEDSDDYYVNPKDGKGGITLNGTLPVENDQGVHSLTDVPVYAMGPCQELFQGTFNSIDIFFNMAECFGLGRGEPQEEK